MQQTLAPDELVIVADSRPFSEEEQRTLRRLLGTLPLRILHNSRVPGVAGAWNTGLEDIRTRHQNTYVAILDDDDEWDAEHLECCMQMASSGTTDADIVVSGLRLIKNGTELPREPLTTLFIDDFLVGNPGWQGSNTFVHIRALIRAGKFTEGLSSTNDRDLAIRLLSLTPLTIRFTGRMSATWHLGREPHTLSLAPTSEKRSALQHFLSLHGHRMSATVRSRFEERCRQLFEVEI